MLNPISLHLLCLLQIDTRKQGSTILGKILIKYLHAYVYKTGRSPVHKQPHTHTCVARPAKHFSFVNTRTHTIFLISPVTFSLFYFLKKFVSFLRRQGWFNCFVCSVRRTMMGRCFKGRQLFPFYLSIRPCTHRATMCTHTYLLTKLTL